MRPATAIANHLIRRATESGKTLTGGQLHHLVYFAHGLRLAMVHEPLLDEAVLADAEGVTIQGLRVHGISGEKAVNGLLLLLTKRADGRIDDDTPTLASDDAAITTLDMVWSRFGSFAAAHMAMFVRSGDSPWANAWHSAERGNRDTVTIANSEIRNWFRRLLIQENKDRSSADGLEPTVLLARYNLASSIPPHRS